MIFHLARYRTWLAVVSFVFGLMAPASLRAQDTAKYQGGASDGSAMAVSILESFSSYDYGDLPSLYALTSKINDGARHSPGTLYLGTGIDSEADGVASNAANGDDLDGDDDEDGIVVYGTWRDGVGGGAVTVSVTGGSGYLSGWIDWNDDGDFDDAGEHVLDLSPVAVGDWQVSFDVPEGSVISGQSYQRFARFRLTASNAEALGLTGLVANGEVEDHLLSFTGQVLDNAKYQGGSADGAAAAVSSSNLIFDYVLVSAKVFLEGAYDTGTHAMTTSLNSGGYLPLSSPYADGHVIDAIHNSDIVDWVLVELRTTKTGSAVASHSALLHKDGRIVADDGSTNQIQLDAPAGDYYIVVRHRNHLAIMSDELVTLSASSPTLYDFTTGIDKVEGGDAALLESGVYGMYGGDANGSGVVTFADKDPINLNVDQHGYYSADTNLTGIITYADKDPINKNVDKSSRLPN